MNAEDGVGCSVSEPNRRVPLSSSQARLWFLDQLSPSDPLHVVSARYLVSGPLDMDGLGQALTEIVDRHHILRTTYHVDEDGPHQVVQPLPPVTVRTWGGPSLGDPHPGATLEAWVEECAAEPFDLIQAPLIRVAVASSGESEHHVCVSVHHIASDGWSMKILDDELWTLYEKALSGTTASLPPLPVQYADLARREATRLGNDGALERERRYWSSRLADTSFVELRPDRDTGPAGRSDGGHVVVQLPPELLARSEQLAKRERASLFVVLQTALFVLLHAYTGAREVVTGMPTAGRTERHEQELIGFFINLLVLRVGVGGGQTLTQVLHETRTAVLDALDHQDMPFDLLVEDVAPQRVSGETPLFQASFQLLYEERASRAIRGTIVEHATPVDSGGTWFDLAFAATRTPSTCDIHLSFSSSRFDVARMENLLTDYVDVLEHLASRPEQRVVDVELPGSRDFVLPDPCRRGSAAAISPSEVLFPEVLRLQASTRPDALALSCGARQISYSQLVDRADDLAAHLTSIGVRRGDIVGLHMGNGADLVVAMVATHAVGAGYVPLPPNHPLDRLVGIAETAALVAVLTDGDDDGRLRVLSDRVVAVRRVPSRDAVRGGPESGSLPVSTTAHQIAYVLFTSGSTGRPKGVEITHANLASMAEGVADLFGIAPGTRVLQLASPAFDVSVYEVFATLWAGGTVCIPDPDVARSPALLSEFLADAGIEVALLPPSMVPLMEPDPELRLTVVALAGEAFGPEVVNVWNQGSRRFLNCYGPTETTVMSLVHECERRHYDVAPPIGRALPGEYAVVVDAYGRPSPVGTPGELVIGGTGVARGYLGDPALTAASFVPSPFGPPGSRVYRTGDVCVVRADGNVVYLGREDDQVKIRGHRVGLLEVERALASLDVVNQAAVVVRDGGNAADRTLAAFITSSGGDTDHISVRRRLLDVLPPYMVPGTVVCVPELPLMNSGKIDRRALARLSEATPIWNGPKRVTLGPTAAMVERLSGIYAERLRLPSVPDDVSFFDLGGNSLQLTSLCLMIRAAFDVQINPQDLLVHQSVLQVRDLLAARMDAASYAEPASDPSDPWRTLHPSGQAAATVLVHDGGGSLFGYQDLQRALGRHGPVYGIDGSHLDLLADGDRVTVKALVSTYVDLLRARLGLSPFVLIGWSFGGLVAQGIHHVADREGLDCRRLVMVDTVHPHDRSAFGGSIERAFFEHLAGSGRLLPSARWSDPEPSASSREHLVRLLQSDGGGGSERWPATAVVQRLARFAALADAAVHHEPRPLTADVVLVNAVGRHGVLDTWVARAVDTPTVADLDGDHFSVVRGRNAERLATMLRST